MSTVMTLGELRTAARQRADMVNSQFVTDPELNSFINQSYFALYNILVQKYGNDYFVADPYTFSTDGVNDKFDLPADFFKGLGVDVNLSNQGDSRVTLKPFNFGDRNKFAVPNFQSFYGLSNLRYRFRGNELWFTPLPTAGQSIRVWYVPRMTTLADDADECDGISGWTEYIIVDAAMKCLMKEESDVSVLLEERNKLVSDIESAAGNRDAGSPATVQDSQSTNYGWPDGFGGGNY